MPEPTEPNPPATTLTEVIPGQSTTDPVPRRFTYGTAPEQFADLWLPAGADGAQMPVVVLVHGGFWRNPFDLTLMNPLADDLAGRGYAVWNVEYLRLGDDGGGWPGTLTDVADAIDELAAIDLSLDLDRVGIVGHSAGGHLALWAAGRAALPDDAPGADPEIVPVVAIGQGAVVDLDGAADAALGRGAVVELLGGSPSEVPERYDLARPRLDAGPAMVSVVGADDDIVPPPFSADPERPEAVEVVAIDGADHFDLIDPTHEAWQAVVERLDRTLGPDVD